MANALSLALICLCVYFAYLYFQSLQRARRFKRFAAENGCQPAPEINPAGRTPFNLDFIWQIIQISKKGGDILDELFLPVMKERGNTVSFFSRFVPDIITTTEPANIKTVLASKFDEYGVGQSRKDAFGILLGDGIFTSDGARWEHSRALFRPLFSRDLINDLQSTEEATRTLLHALGPPEPGQWTEVLDLVPYFLRFTMDTSTEFLFGQSTKSQITAMQGSAGENAEARAFYDAFTVVQEKMILRIRAGLLYWMIDGPQLRRAIKRIRGFVDPLVQQAISIRQQQSDKSVVEDRAAHGEKYSLITALARSNIDQVEVRDQLVALLAAGRDTTATLISWVFYMLALHPNEFQKLRHAILEDIRNGEEGSQELDFVKLKSCKYLQYFLNETLRIFPPVPINVRVAEKDTTLPVGGGVDGKSPIAVAKGATVTYTVYGMHRRKDLWGEDALEFKPERWANRKQDWSYLPFNGGPRVCLGQQYALTEASYLIARMLRHFDAIDIGDVEGLPRLTGLKGDVWEMPKLDGLTKAPRAVTVRLRRAGGQPVSQRAD